jgi:predicted thioesterase
MELLSIRQVATELEISAQTVHYHLRHRHLKGVLIGNSYIVTRDDLEVFKERRRPPGRPKKRRRNSKPLAL